MREMLQNFLLPDSSLFGSSLHIPLLVMTFQKAFIPCLNVGTFDVTNKTYKISYHTTGQPRAHAPKQNLTITGNPHPQFFQFVANIYLSANSYVHLHCLIIYNSRNMH